MKDLNSEFSSIQLPDGRTLAYTQYGDPDGKPVLFIQGAPSTRLFHPNDEISKKMGARVITVDRPGFGRSDFQYRRQILDYPDDIIELMDHLGIGAFAVVGISAGGPYAAACACKIPDRLTHAAIAGGVGPVDVPGALDTMPKQRRAIIRLAKFAPFLVRPIFWLKGNPNRNPDKFYTKFTAHNPAADRVYLDDPVFKKMMTANYCEATRQGVAGFAHEVIILHRPWGFMPEEIKIPVTIWHGDQDNSTPPAMARAMAGAIPQSSLRIFPDEAHFLLLTHWKEMLEILLA